MDGWTALVEMMGAGLITSALIALITVGSARE